MLSRNSPFSKKYQIGEIGFLAAAKKNDEKPVILSVQDTGFFLSIRVILASLSRPANGESRN